MAHYPNASSASPARLADIASPREPGQFAGYSPANDAETVARRLRGAAADAVLGVGRTPALDSCVAVPHAVEHINDKPQNEPHAKA
jgi:hypothetical protein